MLFFSILLWWLCEISMMICEIASVDATKLMAAAMIGCETTMLLRSHPIISSPFRRLALGIIFYFIFIEQCHFLFYGCRVAVLDVAVPISAC